MQYNTVLYSKIKNYSIPNTNTKCFLEEKKLRDLEECEFKNYPSFCEVDSPLKFRYISL